jgi:hypothetical protein
MRETPDENREKSCQELEAFLRGQVRLILILLN